MWTLFESTTNRALTYLDSIQARTVAPTDEAIANLKLFDEPLPDILAGTTHEGLKFIQSSVPVNIFHSKCPTNGVLKGFVIPVTLSSDPPQHITFDPTHPA